MKLNFSLIVLSALASAATATDSTTTYYGYSTTTTSPDSGSPTYAGGGNSTPCVTQTVTETVTNYLSTPTPTPTCPPISDTIWLRRMWNGQELDHFYSTYGPEVAQFGTQGYVEETPQGHIYPTQLSGTLPLWRCATNNGNKLVHFCTADEGEFQAMVAEGCQVMPEPEISEGIGYIYTNPICGAVPLYRLYSPSRVDYFYTTNETERNANTEPLGLYVDQGITGYVLPN